MDKALLEDMMMKIECYIVMVLLAGLSTFADADDLKTPEELSLAYQIAKGNSDFDSVVGDMHPAALKTFKKTTLDIVKAAVGDFSNESVKSAFYELGSLDDLSVIDSEDFWVYVMANVYSNFPEYDGANSIDFIGNVQNENLLHVLYISKRDLKSTSEVEDFNTPKTLTFKKHGNSWCYWSIEVALVEKYVRWAAKKSYAKELEQVSTSQTDIVPRAFVE